MSYFLAAIRAQIAKIILMRFFLVSFITFYAAASVAVTANRTTATANLFDASTGQPGMRTAGSSILTGSQPRFREAKKVDLDFLSELLPIDTITPSYGEAHIVSAAPHTQAADPPRVLPRSPPVFT